MWPFDRIFRKKAKPDYSRLEKPLPSKEEIEEMDSEFREESGEMVTKVLKKTKRL